VPSWTILNATHSRFLVRHARPRALETHTRDQLGPAGTQNPLRWTSCERNHQRFNITVTPTPHPLADPVELSKRLDFAGSTGGLPVKEKGKSHG